MDKIGDIQNWTVKNQKRTKEAYFLSQIKDYSTKLNRLMNIKSDILLNEHEFKT